MTRSLVSRIALVLFVTCLSTPRPAPAQVQRPGERFMLTVPGMDEVSVLENQTYASPRGTPLLFDLYQPAGRAPAGKYPLVVFVNGIGDAPDFKIRTFFQYTGWARLAAASGLAAVNFDVRRDAVREDMLALFDYLGTHASRLGVDADNMALWACSANVREGWWLAMSQKPAGLRAAVFYYGNSPDTTVRSDLPVQLVKSELDGPMINRGIDQAVPRLVRAGAPLEFIAVAGANHAFDVRDDNEVTRSVMRSTIDFLKTWLDPRVQDRLAETAPQRQAIQQFEAGDWQGASQGFKGLLEAAPENGDYANRLAQCYYNLRNFEAAAETYRRAAEVRFAERFTTYNAACCYALIGRKDEALEWLRKCREAGVTDLSSAWNDTDLVSLQADPRFAEIAGPRPAAGK